MTIATIDQLMEMGAAYEVDLPPAPQLPRLPAGAEIAGWIDHTLLKPEATAEQVQTLCQEARQHQFASVCVNPVFVPLAAQELASSGVLVCTVAGFPLGATLTEIKALEALRSMQQGAQEIDMVMNIGAARAGAWAQLLEEIQTMAGTVHSRNGELKVILETALLSRREKILACLVCQQAGADFVKTSTGFGPSGATVEDVDLMYRVVGGRLRVKAAGGIRNYATALAMIQAGATRLGASASVQILREAVG